MKIVTGIFVCLVLLSVSAYILEQVSKHPPLSPSLAAKSSGLQGFPHYIGGTFGEDKANTFLNLINAAATFYRDDLQKNLKYIQENMQAAYGKGNETFSVVIQVNSTNSVTDTFIYNTWGDTCASFPTGVSSINPTWSFFVYILERYDNWVLEYVPHIGQGKGINQATVNAIKEIILKKDGTGKCTCKHTLFIELELNSFDQQYWNVVCHSAPISEGYVLVRDHQWISAKPYSCYYMLYVL